MIKMRNIRIAQKKRHRAKETVDTAKAENAMIYDVAAICILLKP